MSCKPFITDLMFNKIKAKLKLSNQNVNFLGKKLHCSGSLISQKFYKKSITKSELESIAYHLKINTEFLFDNNNKNLIE